MWVKKAKIKSNGKFAAKDTFQSKCVDQTIYINRILTEINELPNIRQIELDFSSPDSAADARIELLKVKENLAAYGIKIEQNLREADRLCHDGAEILSPEQFHALKEGREKLQSTYRNLIEYTDKILKRLDVATALLIEFSTKSSEFHSWIFAKSRELEGTRLRSGDPSRLTESKRDAKQLYDDIIANGDKLREIRQLAVKIESEVRNYIEELKRQDPHAKLPPLHAQDVQNTVQLIQEDYEKLIHDSQLLIQFLNKLNSLSVDHDHNLQEVDQWLADLEASTSSAINTKQSTPDEKLNILLNLSQDAIAKQPKIDEAIRSANDLIAATVSTDAHDSLAKEQEMNLGEIQRRFKNINSKINDSVDATRAEITKKDGVNQGIENILDWISEAEKDVKNSQNLPLIVEKLSNLKYEDQLKRSEMHSQEKILAEIGKEIENLLSTSPTSEATKDLANKYNNAEQRFKRVKSIRKGLSDNLHDVIDAMNDLNSKNNGINKKLLQLQDDLDRIDATDENGIQNLEKDLEEIVNFDWNELSGLAEKILSVPNVTESDGLHEMMNGTSKGITRAQKRLADKVNAGNRLATDKNAFSSKAAEIDAELSEIEESIQYQIRDVSIDDEVIQQKLESCKKIEQRLQKTRNDLEELERIEMDLIHASGANKRRSVILDGTSFGSVGGESINQAKQQLSSLQKRQDEAERDLHKLKSDLGETLENRTKWNSKCDDLQRWLQNENSQLQHRANLTLDSLSLSTTSKEIKAADKRLREKQPELSELRQLSIHLIKKLPSDGHEDEIIPIQKSQNLFEDNFESLETDNSSLELCVATANVFLNDSNSMEKWISAKMRVLDLCSVSADPNLISNHLALLDVLKNEIEDEKPKWQNLNETSENLQKLSKSNSFNNEVSDKMDNLNNKWKNLEDSVNSRTCDLNAAKSLGSQFNGVQKDFTKKLGELESAIDDITKAPINSDADIENQNRQIELVERKLEAELEPLLEQLTKLASEIEEITNDPATKSEAKNRLDSAKTAVDELKKKLDSVKKAAASAKSQGEELLTEFDKKLDWIRETQKDFDSLPTVSADPAKLNEQIEDFANLYQDVLENEGAMVLARAKIADSLQKKPNSMLKRKLESFDEEWKPLLSGVKDRHQLMEKAKKLGDELADLEVKIKNDLNDASQKIEEAKSADSNGNEMPDLTPTEDLLHSLRPSLDGLLSLAKTLEQIAPGPDAKKLNREAENLVADANNLTKECGNQLKLAKARNDLRNQFEKGVIATQMLLDNARNNSGITEQQQDSTDSASKPTVLSKEKLKNLMDELEGNWIRQRRDLDSTANKLKPMIDSNEIEQIDDALTDLDLSYNELKEQFGLASDEMQETESVIGQTAEKGRNLKDEVDELVDRIRELDAIGRDSDTLKEQSDECDAIAAEIEDKKQQLEQLAIEWKKLLDSGKINGTQMIGPQKEMDQINNKLDQQKAKITKRKGEIEDMAFNIDKLTSDAKDLIEKLNDFNDEDIFKQPVASELDELRKQQNAIKQLKSDTLKPMLEETEAITEQCKDLIRSAGPGIPTSELEDTLKSLGDAINDITSKVEERDRIIDSAIQGLGSYNDAYKALLNWIEEIEDLVSNQKPPSADYKVARAQLQNHDFQLKLIDDKQNSVDGFLAMIGKVEALTNDEKTKAALRAKADDISTRYNDLLEGANQRRLNLLDAAQLGEEYANIVKPLSEWIEAVNRELQQLTSVPTNKDKLLEQINSQEHLLHVIGEKAAEVDKLVGIYSELIKLVGADDAAELESTVQEITEKYNNLGKRCNNIGETLRGMTESITNFLEDAESLAQWIENAEKEIERFGEMSIYPEELAAQSEALVNLVSAVTEQQDLVSRVVSDSNELCMHTSGSEAVALQYRIDNLRQRYGQISNDTEQKINAMTEAIPLSEEIQAGFEDISNFIDGCEEDLENLDKLPLEEQSELVSQIEADMVNTRMELEMLNEKSIQLQHLSSKQKADELAKRTTELNRAFDNVNNKALRKADMLSLAERQSKQVFDDLDYALDWFREAHDTILSAEQPAIDTERLKTQLKNQSLMNKDIVEQKANLRNIIAQATKVARELRSTLGGEEVALATKMETARKLADSTAELGHERMAELEQAYALCTELDDSYTDISDWLDTKDEELRSCEPINTGMSPEQLLSHKQHNNQMLQAYRDQYPIIAKFERNVTTLAELCSPEDAQNLSEIASGMIDRFKQQEEEFRERGRILDATIEQSSQFTDRLDSFLSNLESATNKLRNPEPISARPPLLKRQIDDNSEILALLQQKEGHYQAMKEDARSLLAQTQPGDPTAEEVRNKIHALEGLWGEIHDGLNRRSSFLHDTLAKAERFWSELENCQRAVDGLKRNLDSIQLTSADPQMLDENKTKLSEVGYGIDATKPAIDSLRMATENLIANVGEEGKYDVERNMVNLENDWATVTAIYAQMSNNLVDAISRSMDFHELLQQLLAWLIGAEEQIAALPTATLSDPQQIKAELDRISALRADIDKHSMLKEQLNRAADELFKNANPSQVNAIRAPITDLNNRWNKLYAAINDRQQRLERALLEMGQFEQAHAQLESWMDKTDSTLDEIQPNTKDLKHIEIELCKLKVIQNDIQSHVPSFEAINKAGKALIAAEPHTASVTQPKLDTLVDKWHSLTDKSEQLWTKLEISKNDASNRDGELDHWGLWLEDLLAELSHNKPIGGLPETAQSQLDDFCIIKADVEEKRSKFEAELKRILEQIEASTPGNSDNKSMQERYNEMKKNWTRVNEKLVDRQKKLEIALEDAINLNNDMQSMTRWLDNAENYLSNLPQISRLPEALKKQMDSHLAFVDKVGAQREVMSDLNTRGSKIQFTCEKKDAIPIKNRLISLKHRFDKIVNRTADRTKSYENAMGESETYFNARNELVYFLDEADKELQKYGGMPSDSATGERIRETLEEHKKIQEELHNRKPQYETTIKRGRTLEDHAPIGEKSQVHEANEELTRKWKNMNQEAVHRQRSLEDALVQSGKFDEAFAEVSKWLNKTLPKLEDEVTADKSQGDLESLTQIYEEHTNLMDEIKRRKEGVEALKNRAEKILESPETSEKEKEDIRSDLDKLNDEWQRLEEASKIRENQLSEGLKNAVDLAEMTHELENSASHKKGCLHRFGTLLPEDEQETLQLLKKLEDFATEIREKDRPEVDKALELGKNLLEKCHPASEESLKKLLRELSGKWDQIEGSTKDKIDKVNKHLEELREHDQKLSDLKAFIEDKEATLENKDNERDASTIPQVETLLAANDLFKADLNEKQTEVDEIMKAAKKVAAKTEPSPESLASTPDSPTSPLHKKPPLTRGSTKLKLLQQPEKQRKSRRQQKTDAIAEKWRKLWDHTQAYDAKLKQRKEYLAEMKRLENFTFNEWRERYLAFTDHAKARISDLFRRIDTTGTGIVPRQDFINGILNTKFPTTPLEMAGVADEFDKGDGKISSKEFMNALRYDPKKRPPPKTESEMIHEELRKETERCTCARRFPITHISTNDNKVQYGFGFGSTMKRMVRILRSTVMVRVGGGWEKLDEFLVKHDPCRAAGRLNLHIHNTPENAQDQMHEFTPKPRRSDLTRDVLTYADGTPGPISKVREKTERSIPMFKKPYPKATSSRDIPISYSSRRSSDVNFGDSKIPRPSPSISRSGSRQNLSNTPSRPPSRLSDESEERPPSRIPSIRAPKGTPRFAPGAAGTSASSSRTSPHPY